MKQKESYMNCPDKCWSKVDSPFCWCKGNYLRNCKESVEEIDFQSLYDAIDRFKQKFKEDN